MNTDIHFVGQIVKRQLIFSSLVVIAFPEEVVQLDDVSN